MGLLGRCARAALVLRAWQLVLTGPTTGPSRACTDLHTRGWLPAGRLMALAVVIGIVPRVLLDTIAPAARSVVELVSR